MLRFRKLVCVNICGLSPYRVINVDYSKQFNHKKENGNRIVLHGEQIVFEWECSNLLSLLIAFLFSLSYHYY